MSVSDLLVRAEAQLTLATMAPTADTCEVFVARARTLLAHARAEIEGTPPNVTLSLEQLSARRSLRYLEADLREREQVAARRRSCAGESA